MGYTVLIVDDSPVMRSILERAIQAAEIPTSGIHKAENGIQALEVLAKEWIDIVLTDLHMPGMSGLELVERMSRDHLLATIPIVSVTSNRSRVLVEKLEALGIRAHIQKPFRPETIRKVFDEVLHGWARERSGGEGLGPELLGRVARQVLEDSAFVLAEPRATPPDWEGGLVRATLRYRGPESGRLALLTTRRFCRELAAGMLGADPTDEAIASHGPAALAEVLNMMAGVLTEARFGTEVVCELGIPAVEELSAGPTQEDVDKGVKMSLVAGDYRIDVLALTEGDPGG